MGGGRHRAVVVDDAGTRHADAEQRAVGVGDEIVADALHERLGAAAGALVAGVAAPHDHLAGEIDEGGDELLGLGEVEADDVPAVGADPDERRRLAHPTVDARAELLDELLLEQLADDRRRRWRA